MTRWCAGHYHCLEQQIRRHLPWLLSTAAFLSVEQFAVERATKFCFELAAVNWLD
jgi:hypothetical protein